MQIVFLLVGDVYFGLDILLVAFMWLEWSTFTTGDNVFARCWFSGCSLLCM